ncbi:hypothetical protein HAX54_047638 [Datura stramonium]|uniref:Uncharacterized protein n=1 Tax=Datura stramonium TaxID=4076 RepID=A0ABS8WMB3_DATST|nr:hypothetical protein [Datura stramonium]
MARVPPSSSMILCKNTKARGNYANPSFIGRSMDSGALPLQAATPNVNVPQNLFGHIGVVDPARNLVAEGDQEAQKDRVVVIACHPVFEARSWLAPPHCGLANPNIEIAIFALASNFPLQ